MTGSPAPWNGTAVRTWLESRCESARADQVAAERYGYERRDDCDKAAAEEMVCSAFRAKQSVDDRDAFAAALRQMLEQGSYVWRGVYDDRRFDRHVRTCIKKIVRMAKTGIGFDNLSRYQ